MNRIPLQILRQILFASLCLTASGVYAFDDLSPTSDLSLGSSSSMATVRQHGALNRASIDQQGRHQQALVVQAQGSRGGDARILQAGSDNTALVAQYGINNFASLSQAGEGNQALAVQAGNNNMVNFTQFGNRNSAAAVQMGSGNSATFGQFGTGITNRVTQIGNNMHASVITQ